MKPSVVEFDFLTAGPNGIELVFKLSKGHRQVIHISHKDAQALGDSLASVLPSGEM